MWYEFFHDESVRIVLTGLGVVAVLMLIIGILMAATYFLRKRDKWEDSQRVNAVYGPLIFSVAFVLTVVLAIAYFRGGWSWIGQYNPIHLFPNANKSEVSTVAMIDSLRQEADQILVQADSLHGAIANRMHDNAADMAQVDSLRAAAMQISVRADSLEPAAISRFWLWGPAILGLVLALILFRWIKNWILRVAFLVVLPLAGYHWQWFASVKHLVATGIAVAVLILTWRTINQVRNKQGINALASTLAMSWLLLYTTVAVIGITWLLKSHAVQAIIASVISLFGAVWFFYVSNRRFYHQSSETWIAHWPSTLACGVITLGLMTLSMLHWMALLMLLVSFPVAIGLMTQLIKAIQGQTSNTNQVDRQFGGSQGSNWPPLVGIGAGIIVGLAVTVAIIGAKFGDAYIATSLALAVAMPFVVVASFHAGGSQIIDIREVWVGFIMRKLVEEKDKIIFRQSGFDAFVTAGYALTKVNYLLPWCKGVILPYEQKEQLYIGNPVQTRSADGTSRGGEVIDEFSINVLTCRNPVGFLAMGADERRIVTSDEIMTEREGDRGTFGLILRRVKAERRRLLAELDMDHALEAKGTLEALIGPERWKELVDGIFNKTGWTLEEVNFIDVTPEDRIKAAIADVTAAEYQQKKASVDARTAVITAEGAGLAAAKEVEVAAKGIGITKEQYLEYKLRKARADNASHVVMPDELLGGLAKKLIS